VTNSKPLVIELVAQVALAAAIGLLVSLVLAGATLLLAGGAGADSTMSEAPSKHALAVRA